MINLLSRVVTSVILWMLFVGAVYWGRIPYLIFFMFFLSWAAIFEWPLLTRQWTRFSQFLVGFFYFCTPVLVLNAVYVGYRGSGLAAILYPVAICLVCDSAAYFVGKFFGRHYVFPKISPKKTYEGLVAGYAAVLGFHVFLSVSLSSVHGYFGLIIKYPFLTSFLVASVAVLGDLSISLLKRRAGVKDSGALFPGHGGVLDRGGSLILTVFLVGLLMICAR